MKGPESSPASARPQVISNSVLWIILVATSIVGGCGRPPADNQNSPPKPIQTILDGVSDNRPQVLWEALPASYQADLEDLRSIFCTNMDTELYDRTFRILGKITQVLEKKEDYIFNSPMALNTPIIESNIGNHWDEVVGLMDLVVTSEVSSIERLRKIDPNKFLASTGHQFMEDLQYLVQEAQRPGRQDPWEFLNEAIEEARIEFITSTNGQAFLKFKGPNNSTEEVDLTEVEGRWIPSEMAASWDEAVIRGKEGLEQLRGPEFQRIKPILSMALGTVENAVDSLLRAGSQKEFDQTLQNLSSVGDIIKALQPPSEPQAQPE